MTFSKLGQAAGSRVGENTAFGFYYAIYYAILFFTTLFTTLREAPANDLYVFWHIAIRQYGDLKGIAFTGAGKLHAGATVQADFELQGSHRNASSEFSQSLKGVSFVSGLMEIIRGSLKCDFNVHLGKFTQY